MRDLLLGLDLSRKQRGLEIAIRDAIRAGRLRPGDVVPSTRGLAADLDIARATVVAAYDQLVAEGYLATRPGAPTRVAPGQWTTVAKSGERSVPNVRLDLIPGEPDVSRFPRGAWLRCSRVVLAAAGDDLFGYGDPFGLAQLRVELASYLNRARNTAASADAIVVTAGTAGGLGHVARLLSERGTDAIAVEEPGFPFHRPILRRAGLRLVPVPVDAAGINVDALAATKVTAVLVTPAHQYPLGVVMSAQRRSELAAWARERQGWVIEDDYDSEFRYDRQPLGALHGIAPDRVVYLGTASKTLGAGLRVGWMVVPPELRQLMADQLGRDGDVSQLTQAVLARFIADGHLDRHVRRARAVYRSRRDQLLDAVQSAFHDADIRGVAAGLHLTVVLPDQLDERTVVRHASNEHGLGLWGLRQHYLTERAVDGLVLGYCRKPVDFTNSLTRLSSILQQSPTS